ncbi:hypothetical protein HHI36_010129, partial [Cryptolaemus montrouzieri]
FLGYFEHILWADDSALSVEERDLALLHELGTLVESMDRQWFSSNGLCCHLDKSEGMLFSLKKAAVLNNSGS